MPWEGKHLRLTLRITGVWGSGARGTGQMALGEEVLQLPLPSQTPIEVRGQQALGVKKNPLYWTAHSMPGICLTNT